jgi:hypothetical protein
MDYPFKLNKGVSIEALTEGDQSHFFGYFDKAPWNYENKSIFLCHGSSQPNTFPKGKELIDIGYWDIDSKGYNKIGETNAWNFQQGAMLQWVGNSNNILFNSVEGSRAVSKIIDLEGKVLKTNDYPVATLSKDGLTGVSINFGRLNTVRKDYGYPAIDDPFFKEPTPKNDGLIIFNNSNGNFIKLLSLKELSEFGINATISDAFHWVNHPIFNPEGSEVCFLHRYINKVGTRYTRMLTYNIVTGKLTLLIAGMASHFGWRNNSEIVAWAGERNLLAGAQKGIMSKIPVGDILKWGYRQLGKPRFLKQYVLKDNYLLFNILENSKNTINNPLLLSDGHCSFDTSGEWMITDTYPDRKGNVSLILYNISTNVAREIAKFVFPPKWDDEVRCDLHPRWHVSGNYISIDTVINFKRQVLILKIDKSIIFS